MGAGSARRVLGAVLCSGALGAAALTLPSEAYATSHSSLLASSPSPGALDVQQAEAIARPSVVFIETQWTGYLVRAWIGDVNVNRVLGSSGAAKLSVTTSCSGFVADPQGYIVTAGHCVDDEPMRYGGRGLIVDSAVDKVAQKADLSATQTQEVREEAYSNWKVEGKDSGSPPDRVVRVFVAKPDSGRSTANPLVANVVSVHGFKKGDVALLKVASDTPLPVLEVADQPAPANGSRVIAFGYPGSVSRTVDSSMNPSMKDGTVSGNQSVDGVPFVEVSAATSAGMSGGPVIDLSGRAVGTVSWQPNAETQSFNFITATSSMRELLTSSGIKMALSTTDQTYRAGLTDFFAGHYRAAAAKFDQVLSLEPDHALAQEYKRKSVANYPNEKIPAPESGVPLAVLLACGGAVLLLGGGVAVLVIRRRGRRADVRDQHGAGPVPFTGAPPASFTTTAPPPTFTGPATSASWSDPGSESALPPQPSAGAAQGVGGNGHCPGCGRPRTAEARFCSWCGTSAGAPGSGPGGA